MLPLAFSEKLLKSTTTFVSEGNLSFDCGLMSHLVVVLATETMLLQTMLNNEMTFYFCYSQRIPQDDLEWNLQIPQPLIMGSSNDC